jgi:hypothetical protein
MGSKIRQDVARQAANVVGALFQTGMTVAASATIQGVAAEGPRSLVEPALYAFTIWALIFALSLAYAAYQALPAKRQSPLGVRDVPGTKQVRARMRLYRPIAHVESHLAF